MSTPTSKPVNQREHLRDLREQWSNKFLPLCGRKIQGIRYMHPKEAEMCGWHRTPLVIVLDDSTLIWASSDDEGNDAGALFFQPGRLTQGLPDGAPVI